VNLSFDLLHDEDLVSRMQLSYAARLATRHDAQLKLMIPPVMSVTRAEQWSTGISPADAK
jgi:hypothetical protein